MLNRETGNLLCEKANGKQLKRWRKCFGYVQLNTQHLSVVHRVLRAQMCSGLPGEGSTVWNHVPQTCQLILPYQSYQPNRHRLMWTNSAWLCKFWLQVILSLGQNIHNHPHITAIGKQCCSLEETPCDRRRRTLNSFSSIKPHQNLIPRFLLFQVKWLVNLKCQLRTSSSPTRHF